jgi:hypothetical protein
MIYRKSYWCLVRSGHRHSIGLVAAIANITPKIVEVCVTTLSLLYTVQLAAVVFIDTHSYSVEANRTYWCPST